MAGIDLKVSPDTLKTKAQEIQSQISRFESYWNQLNQIVRNTKGYWIGDASNSHQSQMSDYEEDVRRLLLRLKEHPNDLLKMAGIYEKVEETAVKSANTLPGDVII